MASAGETGGIGEKEVEAISTQAEQKSGAESLAPVEKIKDASLEGQSAGEEGTVTSAVKDGLQAIGSLVTGVAQAPMAFTLTQAAADLQRPTCYFPQTRLYYN